MYWLPVLIAAGCVAWQPHGKFGLVGLGFMVGVIYTASPRQWR